MLEKIIARELEIKQLSDIFRSPKSSFLAVLGRRRVGKTFLIDNFFSGQKSLYFKSTGKRNGTLSEQLRLFTQSLQNTFFKGLEASITPPTDWLQALNLLTQLAEKFGEKQKIILFFDEVPWLASRKSGFIDALEYYWNMYWSKNNKLKLIICGSAASWMLENVLDNKGGLYNRVTDIIKLLPFTLKQTEEYLNSSGIKLNRNHIVDIYMCIGGIPHYLNYLDKGKSATQLIDKLCFQRSSIMREEFSKLFKSLFDNAELYEKLVRIISKKSSGISRADLIKQSGMTSGGTFAKRIEALDKSGFIVQFTPYGSTEKGNYYKVIDEYSLFYLKWIEPFVKRYPSELDALDGYWNTQISTAAYKAWSGLAFEAVCYRHTAQIRKGLKLPNNALPSTWRYKPRIASKGRGAQIDLLFDREDSAITLCEIKYYKEPFVITKSVSENISNKMKVFSEQTRTKKQLFFVFISPYGIKENQYSGICSNCVVLNDFFS